MFKNDANYLDQHFLVDEDIINKYIDFPKFNKNDVITDLSSLKEDRKIIIYNS